MPATRPDIPRDRPAPYDASSYTPPLPQHHQHHQHQYDLFQPAYDLPRGYAYAGGPGGEAGTTGSVYGGPHEYLHDERHGHDGRFAHSASYAQPPPFFSGGGSPYLPYPPPPPIPRLQQPPPHGNGGLPVAALVHSTMTDEAGTKLGPGVRRQCFNCRTTETSTWRRSNLSQGKMLCNKCGLYERTHSRSRPDQLLPQKHLADGEPVGKNRAPSRSLAIPTRPPSMPQYPPTSPSPSGYPRSPYDTTDLNLTAGLTPNTQPSSYFDSVPASSSPRHPHLDQPQRSPYTHPALSSSPYSHPQPHPAHHWDYNAALGGGGMPQRVSTRPWELGLVGGSGGLEELEGAGHTAENAEPSAANRFTFVNSEPAPVSVSVVHTSSSGSVSVSTSKAKTKAKARASKRRSTRRGSGSEEDDSDGEYIPGRD